MGFEAAHYDTNPQISHLHTYCNSIMSTFGWQEPCGYSQLLQSCIPFWHLENQLVFSLTTVHFWPHPSEFNKPKRNIFLTHQGPAEFKTHKSQNVQGEKKNETGNTTKETVWMCFPGVISLGVLTLSNYCISPNVHLTLSRWKYQEMSQTKTKKGVGLRDYIKVKLINIWENKNLPCFWDSPILMKRTRTI